MQEKQCFPLKKCKIENCILHGINALHLSKLKENTCNAGNCRLHSIV